MKPEQGFPRYSEYRDSGAEWLGQIPVHWEAKAIKRLSPVKRGASPRPIDDPVYFDDGGDYGWVRISDVSSSPMVLMETEQRLSKLGASLSVKLEPGQLFLSIAGSVGKACISGTRVCIHDGFVYFPGLKIPRTWLYHIFESKLPFGGLGKMGTQLNLNTDTVGSIFVPVPPGPEMKDILVFLASETSKIDTLINKQERLMILLAEKRQAIISQAITQGLDPHVPLKDSIIEWASKVPIHWETMRLKQIASLRSGETINSDSIKDTGRFPVYGGNGLRGFTDKHTHCGTYPLIGRQGALCGNVNYGSGLFWASEHAIVVTPKPDIDVTWIGETLRIMNLNQHSVSAAQPGLSVKVIENLPIPVPPFEEQKKIADYILHETSKIDTIIAKSQQSISLLKERRCALISDAVTGEIDVRKVS